MIKDPEIEHRSSIEKKTSRNLTRLYITALTAVAVLTITGQVLVQVSINKQLSDSHVVNLAGKQRYMSQQICKVVLLLYSNIDHIHYPDKIESLKKLVHDWERNHLALQHGDPKLNLDGKNSPKVIQMFKALDPYFKSILYGTLDILKIKQAQGDPEKDKLQIEKAVKTILKNEKLFLYNMDAIVHQYDAEAKEKVVLLRKIEMFLLIITLLILFIEGLFIFRPAAITIKNTIRDLIMAEDKASNLAKKLMTANVSLQSSLKNLKDVNYALDNATILAKTDQYGIITFVNEKFCEISGYSEGELLGNRFDMISGHYHSSTFFDNLWGTISSGRIWNNEIKNKAKDGTFFWLDATIVPVMSANNSAPDQYIAIYTDITQRFRQSINEQKIRSASLIEGQEKERRKIARELHDGLGQMLTALKFNIEGIKGAPSKKEKQNLDEIRKFMLETIKEVRRISFNLMPSVLNDFGVIPAFRHLSEQISKHYGINIIFENKSSVQRLHKTVEINLYRIVQEALNNAVKYAEANEVIILLENTETILKLHITDNGIGFNSKNIDKKNMVSSGNGISNIQERTSLINGDFKMETAPGQGTRIHIEIPLN
jgi:PAS domain S-box-containing protein